MAHVSTLSFLLSWCCLHHERNFFNFLLYPLSQSFPNSSLSNYIDPHALVIEGTVPHSFLLSSGCHSIVNVSSFLLRYPSFTYLLSLWKYKCVTGLSPSYTPLPETLLTILSKTFFLLFPDMNLLSILFPSPHPLLFLLLHPQVNTWTLFRVLSLILSYCYSGSSQTEVIVIIVNSSHSWALTNQNKYWP